MLERKILTQIRLKSRAALLTLIESRPTCPFAEALGSAVVALELSDLGLTQILADVDEQVRAIRNNSVNDTKGGR